MPKLRKILDGRTKPPIGWVELNRGHHLAHGLSAFWVFHELAGDIIFDYVAQNHLTRAGTAKPSWTTSAHGFALTNNGTTTGRLDPVRPLDASTRWTIGSKLAIHSAGDSSFGRIWVNESSDNTRLLTDGAITTMSMNINATSVFSGVNLGITASQIHGLGFRADGTNILTQRDDANVRSADSHVDFPATNKLFLANRTGNDRAGDVTYHAFAYWTRALSADELREWFWAPYELLVPIRRRVIVSVGGVVTYTGTAALNAGPATLSGAATFSAGTKTATAALVAGNAELAATGTTSVPVYTGTMAATVGAATLAGAGEFDAPVFTGTMAVSAGAATLAGSAIFASAVFSGLAELAAGNAELSGSATFFQDFNATAALVVGGADLTGSATYTAGASEVIDISKIRINTIPRIRAYLNTSPRITASIGV